MRLRVLAFGVISLLGVWAPQARAASVYVSAADDGADSGVATVLAGSGDTALAVWLDTDEAFYEYVVSFAADPGFALISFTADPIADAAVAPEVVLTPGDGGTLAVLSGSALDVHTGPIRIGTLVVAGLTAGAQLRLESIAGVVAPAFVNAAFDVVPIDVPQLVAQVGSANPIPEPGSVLLFCAGALAVLASVRRRPG